MKECSTSNCWVQSSHRRCYKVVKWRTKGVTWGGGDTNRDVLMSIKSARLSYHLVKSGPNGTLHSTSSSSVGCAVLRISSRNSTFTLWVFLHERTVYGHLIAMNSMIHEFVWQIEFRVWKSFPESYFIHSNEWSAPHISSDVSNSFRWVSKKSGFIQFLYYKVALVCALLDNIPER